MKFDPSLERQRQNMMNTERPFGMGAEAQQVKPETLAETLRYITESLNVIEGQADRLEQTIIGPHVEDRQKQPHGASSVVEIVAEISRRLSLLQQQLTRLVEVAG